MPSKVRNTPIHGDWLFLTSGDASLPLSPRQAAAAASEPLQYGLVYASAIPSSGRYAIGIDAYMQPVTSGSPGNCSLAICGTTFPCAPARPLTSSWLSIRMTAYFYVNSTLQDFIFNVTCYKPAYIAYRNVVIPGQAIAGAASTLVRTVVNTATLTVSLPRATDHITLVSSIELPRATTTLERPVVTQSISLARQTETLTTLSISERVSTVDRISTLKEVSTLEQTTTLDRISTVERISTQDRISTLERVTTVEATTSISFAAETVTTTQELPQATTSIYLPRETETFSILSTISLPQATTTEFAAQQTATDTLTLATSIEKTVSLPGETVYTTLPQDTATRTLERETDTISLTNTIETTISSPQETLTTTVEKPEATTTLSIPPGTGTLTLYSTVVPTQATTTLSLPRATQTILVGVEPVCPGSDGVTYALSDGSTFVVVCRKDRIGYDRYLIIGLPEVPGVQSFLACLYLCMQQGTACMGVDYDKVAGVCGLKYGTAPYGGAYDYMAMRVGGPTNGPSARQIIVNGDFSNGLASWNARPNSLTLQNGAAMIPMNPDSSGFSQEQVTQSLSGAVAGDSFFLSMRLNMPPGNTHCSFNINIGNGYYGSWDFGGSGIAYSGLVNASGIFQTPPTELRLQFTCYNSPQLSIAIDDVSLSVFAQSTGADPIALLPVEAIDNNDFANGLQPWYDTMFFFNAIQVVNGQAVMTPMSNQDVALEQYFTSTFGQNVRLQADVDFSIAGGDTCTASLTSGYYGQVFWTKQVSASEPDRVDQSFTLGAPAMRLDLTVNCVGSGGSSVAFDNVYFTLNAF